jgi:hypothetical protein
VGERPRGGGCWSCVGARIISMRVIFILNEIWTQDKIYILYLSILMQYVNHLIFSLYATFNKDFCVYYKHTHVSAHVGHLQVLTVLYLFMLTY